MQLILSLMLKIKTFPYQVESTNRERGSWHRDSIRASRAAVLSSNHYILEIVQVKLWAQRAFLLGQEQGTLTPKRSNIGPNLLGFPLLPSY